MQSEGDLDTPLTTSSAYSLFKSKRVANNVVLFLRTETLNKGFKSQVFRNPSLKIMVLYCDAVKASCCGCREVLNPHS